MDTCNPLVACISSLVTQRTSHKWYRWIERRRWMDNIKMNLLETRLNVVDWIGLAQDRYRW
jgi:hypothetical protein